MQKFSTWMIVSLDVIFWMLRIVSTYTYTIGMEFMIKPLDTNVEIALIFFTLLAFILIVKRKLLGPVIYMIGYYGYFGVALYKNIVQMQTVGGMIDDYLSVFISFIGIILPTLTMFDWLLDKNKKLHQFTNINFLSKLFRLFS